MNEQSLSTASPAASKVKLKVVSQAFRYCDYNAGRSMSRMIRIGVKPMQFVVNTWCDESLREKEVEIGVEIRDRETGETIFETFWVTTITYCRQQSSFIFREFPEELMNLTQGRSYTYHASAMINETDDFAERETRAIAK